MVLVFKLILMQKLHIAGPGYAIQAPAPVLDWPNSFRAEYVYLNISGDVVN